MYQHPTSGTSEEVLREPTANPPLRAPSEELSPEMDTGPANSTACSHPTKSPPTPH